MSTKAESDLGGVAIVGMACRFPGSDNIDDYWHNLKTGAECLTYFSDEEIIASRVDPAVRADPNYVKVGAVLSDVAGFDAGFFGINSSEATLMDPQQRIFLECAWEALENSGYVPVGLDGVVGVYAGSRISEYMLFNQTPPDLAGLGDDSPITNFQRLVGNDKDYLATRTSFKLNLTGPSLTVQTACSTSLVAVHLACEGLINGETDLALAGGIAVRVPQRAGYLHTEGMIFSADGHTRTFDVNATGTIFSSGAGIVVLKRLEEALADGDNIYAVIRGSAVNNDGSADKAGYTAPSQSGQASVITQAMEIAGFAPETLSYIETHGTGTALGDVIEIAALKDVFRVQTDARNFCALGSVKTNIGHAVQAAGVAGLIKTALMLKHRQIVPSLNFKTPNPELGLDDSPFYIATEMKGWPADGTPRRAGVSSFGVGGTNASVMLEEAPPCNRSKAELDRTHYLLTLSAKGDTALEALADRYSGFLAAGRETLRDVCCTTNVGRAHFPRRLAVVGSSEAGVSEQLEAFAAGYKAGGIITAQNDVGEQPKVAFLFTGQGSQYPGMGRQLYASQPVYRDAIDRCAEVLDSCLDQPLANILRPDTQGTIQGLINQTAYAQPALFAVEYALARLWQSWGVEPACVAGHSVGEYVAACIAGVFSLEDGLRLIVERGRLMQDVSVPGAMASVFSDEARVSEIIAEHASSVSIAALNGPDHTVISGRATDVHSIVDRLQNEGCRVQMLNVSHAFHSPLMDPILDAFERAAEAYKFNASSVSLISNLTGEQLTIAPDADYWRQHIRAPVQFAKSMDSLRGLGCNCFIEIGPQSTLLAMGRRCWPEGSGLWLPSLRKDNSDEAQIYESVAMYYVHQGDVDWVQFEAPFGARRVAVPTYPFQRQRYWLEPPDREPPARRLTYDTHPLLGSRLSSPLKVVQFETHVSATSPAFLSDHRVYDTPILPATAYIEMVVAAARDALGDGSSVVTIEEMVIERAIMLSDTTETVIQLVLAPLEEGGATFEIFSQSASGADDWSRHTTGRVRAEPPTDVKTIDLPSIEGNVRDISFNRCLLRGKAHAGTAPWRFVPGRRRTAT